MKCKCCKCYKEIEEREQVKEEHAIWCQHCHYKHRVYNWVMIGIVIVFFIAVLAYWWKKVMNRNE